MASVDKDLERLIVRQLDGELDEDERLELNRQLIRDPEAQQLMDDYRRIDGLATRAIGGVLGEGQPAFDPAALTQASRLPQPRRIHRGWWLVPGAIAAALLALAIPRPTFTTPQAPGPTVVDRKPTAPLPIVAPQADNRENLMHTVGMPRIQRDTGREVFGVVGDDGNLYWIEVDRTRTVRQPARRFGVPGTGEAL